MKPITDNSFRDIVKFFVAILGKKEIADRLGRSQATITNWITGKRFPVDVMKKQVIDELLRYSHEELERFSK